MLLSEILRQSSNPNLFTDRGMRMLLNELRETHKDLAHKVIEYMKQNDQSIESVSKKIGIRNFTLRDFLNGGKKFNVVTFLKIQKFLDKFGNDQ